MIYVSDAWKNAHKQMILPESFVEITMGVMDDTVMGTVSGEMPHPVSTPSLVINNQELEFKSEYALLEHNLWSLDGSKIVTDPDATEYPRAYVTEADSMGSLTITLPQVNYNQIPGFVITWSAEYETYASQFTVTVKNGNTVVATTTVTNNTSNVSRLDMPVSGYDSVTITVTEWSHPDQRSRIDSVMFGQRIVFTKDDIVSYSHEQSGSPLGTELSKNAIEFEVDNSDGRWNPLNYSGMAKYLYERQKVTVRYGLQTISGVEWMQAGVFYLSEWKAPSNGITASFVARDAIGFMMDATYSRSHVDGVIVEDGRVYLTKDDAVYINSDDHLVTVLPSGTNVKVYEKTVWYPEGTGNNPTDPGVMVYRIDQGWLWADYVNIPSEPFLTEDIGKAMMGCLPDDIIRMADGDNAFGVRAPVAIEEKNVAEFVQQCLATYGETVWQSADGILIMADPMVGKILGDYVISADTSYSHPEVELAKPLKNVNIVQHYEHTFSPTTAVYTVGISGEDITVDCPYLWYYETNRSNRLAAKHIDWWKNREVVSGEFRADPRLELFDVVTVETKYGTLSPVMITYVKYTYNGSFRGTYEGKVITIEEV